MRRLLHDGGGIGLVDGESVSDAVSRAFAIARINHPIELTQETWRAALRYCFGNLARVYRLIGQRHRLNR